MSLFLADQDAASSAFAPRPYRFADYVSDYCWIAPPPIKAEVYVDPDPLTFDLAKFADPRSLYAVWRHCATYRGQAAGVDGLTWDDFSPREVHDCLRRLSEDLRARSYRPAETREAFIPKRGGRRLLEISLLGDRVVAEALHQFISPFCRQIVPPKSVWKLYADLEREIRCSGNYYLATGDIRNFFPSVRIDDALASLPPPLRQPDLLALIEIVLRGHEGAARTHGLPQGNPLSPVMSELRLLSAGTDSAAVPARLTRYVDNIVISCRDVCEGNEALERTATLLRTLSLELVSDGDPVDLRNRAHGRIVLGMIPVWRNDRLDFQIPEVAYEVLQWKLSRLWERPHPTTHAISLVNGWIQSAGPAFGRIGSDRVVEKAMRVAAREGFGEIPRMTLRNTAEKSLRRWERLRTGATR